MFCIVLYCIVLNELWYYLIDAVEKGSLSSRANLEIEIEIEIDDTLHNSRVICNIDTRCTLTPKSQ